MVNRLSDIVTEVRLAARNDEPVDGEFVAHGKSCDILQSPAVRQEGCSL